MEGIGPGEPDGGAVGGDEDLELARGQALALEKIQAGRQPTISRRGKDDEAEAG